jgi:hypothetical protein
MRVSLLEVIRYLSLSVNLMQVRFCKCLLITVITFPEYALYKKLIGTEQSFIKFFNI